MIFQLKYPEEAQLLEYYQQQTHDDFSYPEIEGTKHNHQQGYDNDYHVTSLGRGEAVWQAAKDAIRNWDQYPAKWTNIYPTRAPLQVEQTVVVVFRVLGLWWLNSARIVYVIDEPDRFGWAYGTLRDHVESGEECFWLEKNPTGEVTYHIRAFSKPAFWMVKLGYPLARRWQAAFVRESMEQMRQITQNAQSLAL